jgi:hypothetical protein
LLPLDREYDEGEKTLALLLPELLSIGRRIALRECGTHTFGCLKIESVRPTPSSSAKRFFETDGWPGQVPGNDEF